MTAATRRPLIPYALRTEQRLEVPRWLPVATTIGAVVLLPIVPAGSSPFVVVPLMLVAGVAAGALWGGLAGWLKARFNVNEIISTLMLNYIAILWVRYWVFGPWSEGGFQLSKQFPREAWLPRLTDFAKVIPDFAGLTTHLGFLIGLIC